MISTKKHIQQLAALLAEKGISDVVISPGSRNGPIIHTLFGSGRFNCRNIVDERSAAYFAIGLSQAIKKPVAIVCSSGTATLNYAPAVAEAFYLNTPLVVLTADRPGYWINQGESQCIPQKNIYREFSKMEVNLPMEETDAELVQAGQLINDCLDIVVSETPGPVHINIPLEEPLHDLVEAELPEININPINTCSKEITNTQVQELASAINKAKKILILGGQQIPDIQLEKSLAEFAEKTGSVVLNEHLSNLHRDYFCRSIDTLMASLLNDTIEDYQPDLLITFGGQFVSKSLKQFLRKYQPIQHWHISANNEHLDTYQCLSKVIPTDASTFFSSLLDPVEKKGKAYWKKWKQQEETVNVLRDSYVRKAEFSDLVVFDVITAQLPKNSILHLGNSSPVRYALIFNQAKEVEYYGNRGTAGIDGSLSTAVGFASISEKINTVILGDLSFFYDSNGLWNKYLGNNLRIIVINNGGGNIFGLIKGPSDSPAFKDHFFTENKDKAEALASAFSLEYLKAENKNELDIALTRFFSDKMDKPALLEVFTNAETNTQTFRGLFKHVKIKD